MGGQLAKLVWTEKGPQRVNDMKTAWRAARPRRDLFDGYQFLFVLNPLSTCSTVSGTIALSGAPLIFPSIDIATSPWSAAPMVRAKRSGSPATIFPAS